MIDILQQKLGSMTKALEILYILEGVKPAARIMVDEEKVSEIRKLLEEHKLNIAVSDFKIKKEIDSSRNFSDKGVKLSRDSKEKGQFFLYISKDKEKTLLAKKLEGENRHKELGIALGYPECCSEFFEKNFPIESKKQNDYTLATLRNSSGYKFPLYNNIAIRHLDLTLLSHFPCSFNCAKSIVMAKKHLICVEKHSRELSLIFQGMLKGAVIYTENSGVFLLRKFKLDNNKVSYGGIMATANNEFYSKLKKNDEIDVIGKNHIKIDNEEFKDIGFMVFE